MIKKEIKKMWKTFGWDQPQTPYEKFEDAMQGIALVLIVILISMA